jgi:hypothetical protein
VEKKFLGHISTFLKLKSPIRKKRLNFEKHLLQKCLRIAFYTYIPVNLYHCLKKHHNRRTLECSHHWSLGSRSFRVTTDVIRSENSSSQRYNRYSFRKGYRSYSSHAVDSQCLGTHYSIDLSIFNRKKV